MTTSAAGGFYLDRPLVIAHRGASDVAPENTLAAFEAACRLGADGIELDVSRCGSGEIVVMHDATVDRTTGGSGRIADIDLGTLRKLDAGSWFAPQFAGQRIPTLREVLDLFAHRLCINIEIKAGGLRADGIEREVAEMVRARDLLQEVIISSFSPLTLWRCMRTTPALQRGLLHATPLSVVARPAVRALLRPTALHPHHYLVSSGYMRWAHRQGYRVSAWTVDEPSEMQRLIALGIDAMITNRPAVLRELLSHRAGARG